MLFRSNDTATTEIYTQACTLSLHDALPIPSQREATQKPSTAAPETSTSQPADASTPHQREAMKKPQTMTECMDAQAAKKPAPSKDEMTKTCNEHMKMQKQTR